MIISNIKITKINANAFNMFYPKFKQMSETPLSQKNILNNDSGLTNTLAYSQHQHSLDTLPLKTDSLSQADSCEKILSSSILRAKQKITMLQNRQREERADSRQEKVHSKEGLSVHSNAVASAMKILQNRVSELQRTLQSNERERSIIMKELDNLSSQKKIILSNLQESNRKVTQLEQSARLSKAELKQLMKQLQDLMAEKSQLSNKCQGLQLTIKHLQNDKQQISLSLSRREKENTQKQNITHKELILKLTEIQEKEMQVAERQRRTADKQKKMQQLQRKMWEENHLLKRQIEALQSLQKGTNEEGQQKESYDGYLKQINQMEGQLRMLRQTTKMMVQSQSIVNQQNQVVLKETLSDLKQKNEELMHLYRRSEDRCKREEKQSKIVKDRMRELQDMLTEFIQKVGKLSNNNKQLKFLVIKAGKIMAKSVERLTTLRTPTKSRSKSINRASGSKSHSNRKPLISQLDNSRESIRDNNKNSGSKQKKTQNSNSKVKRVVVSQAGWESLEKQIAEMKKQYKRLVKEVNQSQNEAARNRLNVLVFQIQEKGERLTKLKQQSKNK